MNQRFVRFFGTDGVELVGILYTPDTETKKGIIHVHGMADNFYMNRFVQSLAETYTKNGYSFLTFSNRGRDYINSLIKIEDGKPRTFISGSICEIFEDCIYDIQGAVELLKLNGIEEITLQGHSYGCNKVVYYYSKYKENIKNIIMLSPCDSVAKFKEVLGDEYDSYYSTCQNNVESDNGNIIVENDRFKPLGFASKTFVNNYTSGKPSDVFKYNYDEEYINPLLEQIEVPICIRIGSKDYYSLIINKENVKQHLSRNLKNADLDIDFIENANHFYFGKENELADSINKYIDKLNNC